LVVETVVGVVACFAEFVGSQETESAQPVASNINKYPHTMVAKPYLIEIATTGNFFSTDSRTNRA